MPKAKWYFDFISPFAYLQLARFNELPQDLEVELKPVLFAGLRKHWGHLGPAEIPSKRRFVYRFFRWQAERRGLPFLMPPSHPFNPLPALRLALAAGPDLRTVRAIFHHIYGEGNQPDAADAISAIAAQLGVEDVVADLSDPFVKEALRNNTNEALKAGVFGVPTFLVNGELFWGDDATDMLLDYLRNPELFNSGEMARLSSMPMGVRRRTRL